jgi:tetratricopeptide (TPR) repeat protein
MSEGYRMRARAIPGFLLLLWPALIFAQASAPSKTPSALSLYLSPGVDFPLGASSTVYGLGGSMRFGAEYRLPFLPLLYASGGIGYNYDTANGVPLTVSVTSAGIGGGIRYDFLPWLTASVGVSGGYFYSFLNDFSTMGGNPFLIADAGLAFLPGPLRVTVGASYLSYFGLYSGLSASLGLSYDFARASAAAVKVQQQLPVKPQPLNGKAPLELKELAFDDIYPVFHTYYDTHPLGKFVLTNTSAQQVTGIKVSFQIKEFMADPKDCPAPAQLAAGESKSVDLFGLFLPTILQTTEKTKTQAKVDVEYMLDGQVQHQSLVQSIPILDRNATTWADDRRAAAFVTTKDPAVLTFSKNVNSMVKGKLRGSVNPNLLTAMAFFQALQLFGLTYSQDPIPTATANKLVADYIQFPRQTLQYKGGKCSDFSVLYAALLESVGIETAFITIPGHIFMAFSTGLTPEDARKSFSRSDDLIYKTEAWIPVEVTETAGFLKAWQDGAKEWRENFSRDQAAFYPLHEAWQLYEPVGLPGADATVTLPPVEKILSAYQGEAGRFIDQEISTKVAALQSQISAAKDARKPTNDLGVLYARYGLLDRAQKQFSMLLAKEDYVPALLNMGNILYLGDQKEKALDYYNRAYAKDPKNPRVLLAVAKASHDLEDYFRVKKVYAELKARDPELAAQFAYLDLKGEESTRAANAAGVSGVVVWEE